MELHEIQQYLADELDKLSPAQQQREVILLLADIAASLRVIAGPGNTETALISDPALHCPTCRECGAPATHRCSNAHSVLTCDVHHGSMCCEAL